MIWKYIKYFKKNKTACPCCGENEMNPRTLLRIDLVREHCGFPLVVNSAYRCKKHNKKVKGKKDSSHMQGHALDIKMLSKRQRSIFVFYARLFGFHRMGIYKRFVHVDDDPNKPPEVTWVEGE